jgi:hypothetical protein
VTEPREDRSASAPLGLGSRPRLRPPRSEPEDQQCDAEQERQNRFDRLVRVEPRDGGLAEEQAEAAGDRRSDQEPDQEGDAVRARALAVNTSGLAAAARA